jgi:outer membrane protein TolC
MINGRTAALLLLVSAILPGCQSARSVTARSDAEKKPVPRIQVPAESATTARRPERIEVSIDEATEQSTGIVPVSSSSSDDPSSSEDHSTSVVSKAAESDSAARLTGSAEDSSLMTVPTVAGHNPIRKLELNEVVQSIHASYPLLQIAFYGRNIAEGEQLSAEGAWDLKLKADANNAPLGYYQTYRNGVGFEQPTYWGGEVFGGYKNGSGNFEPWYGNRQTNQGGEFNAGIRFPLLQNRGIDERRATLWKSIYGRNAVEPFIQAQLIEFIRAGSYAYWDWVAAGLAFRFSDQLLDLAQKRDEQIRRQVELGARPESDLTDNQRLIISRDVKRIEAHRKVQTAAIKLSLFLRKPSGEPHVADDDSLPARFPDPTPVTNDTIVGDIAEALSRRPELRDLDFQYRMGHVDLEQARNLIQPELNATVWSAKDAGGWSTPSGNKAPYQAEAGLNFSVPVQRRKALGKVAAAEAKLVQIATKRRFAEDKISTEVKSAVATLDAAYRSIDKARESVVLNEKMQAFEVIKLNKGDSDLLRLNIRETATFDARVVEIEAFLHYFESKADYRAALATDIAIEDAVPLPPEPAR